MSSDDWRHYVRHAPVLQNRLQSIAFLSGEGLSPLPLKQDTNHNDLARRTNISEWTYLDAPPHENWGCALRVPWVDLDIDCDPLRGDPDEAFLAEARAVVESVENALVRFGIDFRGFGRTSMGNRGHFVLPVALGKGDNELLRNLHMARPCRSGNVKVRIEVRRPPEKKVGESAKNFTLPGSTYRHPVTGELDLIGWQVLGTFREGESMARLEPQSLDRLRVALYAAQLTLAMAPHWVKGSRHHRAVDVAGALAREHMAGSLTEQDCAAVMEHLLAEVGDDEPEDRLQCLADSIHGLSRGRRVTGYKTLAEVIGDDWRASLLRLRGGGDPDTLAALFDTVVRIRYGRKQSDCYVDLSAGASAYVEHDPTNLRLRFKARPEYPKIPDSKGRLVEPIELVMHSPLIRTYDRALSLPGIPFGVPYFYDTEIGDWVEITEDNPAPTGATTALNVAAGFPTRILADHGEKPDVRDWAEALRLYRRLRAHLTQDDPEQNAQLDQVIARKLQKVREKYPVGCALVGGQGIGKSFLFDVMLAALIGGDLIRKSNTSELKSDYRFTGVERVLFYVFEEARFQGLPGETLQLLKDLMRNVNIFRNAKYGVIGDVSNIVVPFFLSNEQNPKLMFDGRADRALIVIRGEAQETLSCSLTEWTDHKRKIHAECAEFTTALKRPEMREALLHYFMSLDLDDELGMTSEEADSEDLRGALHPALDAIVEMVESGYIMPERRGDRGPMITEPFTMGTLAAGIRERLRNRGTSTFQTSSQGVGMLVSELFCANTRQKGVHLSKGLTRDQREHTMLVQARLYVDKSAKALYYFRYQRGMLLRLLREKRGLEIEPEYELNGGEMGLIPPPSKEALQKSWAFATELGHSSMWRDMGFS